MSLLTNTTLLASIALIQKSKTESSAEIKIKGMESFGEPVFKILQTSIPFISARLLSQIIRLGVQVVIFFNSE